MTEKRLAVGMALLLAAASPLPAAESATDETSGSLELWKDPRFQGEFLGSFGFNAEIEPKLDEDEREGMREIIPLLDSGDLEAAAAALEKLITPESSAVLDFTLANVYFQEDRLDDAVRDYESALRKFPNFRRAYKNLGLIHVREGRLREALTPLSRVIQLGGGDGLTYGLLGFAYSGTGQYVAAESAYRSALLLQPDVLDWKLGLTQSLLKQGKNAEVVQLTDELLAGYPERADFWLLQANAYIGMEKPLEAAKNFEIVDRLGKSTAASMLTLGDIYVNESLWDLGTRAYHRSLVLDPDQDVDGPIRRVEALAQRDALRQAGELLDAVKETFGDRLGDEERVKLLKLEARIAVAGGEDGEDVVQVLEEIVALDPLDGEALLLLGQHYAREDDPERAIFYYERAAGLDGFEADASVRQAQVLVGQARYKEAVPLLQRAQKLRPRDDVGRYLEQVERIARTQS
jgi:tetratricopeptide (TPR) repeat protein